MPKMTEEKIHARQVKELIRLTNEEHRLNNYLDGLPKRTPTLTNDHIHAITKLHKIQKLIYR